MVLSGSIDDSPAWRSRCTIIRDLLTAVLRGSPDLTRVELESISKCCGPLKGSAQAISASASNDIFQHVAKPHRCFAAQGSNPVFPKTLTALDPQTKIEFEKGHWLIAKEGPKPHVQRQK